MMRRLHAIFGLIGAFALAALTLTGAMLAVEPVAERISSPGSSNGTVSVAATAQAAASRYPGIQKLSRSPGGTLIVHRRLGDEETKLRIDPRTAAPLGPSDRALVMQWAAEFHRSFLLGDFGRATAGSLRCLDAGLGCVRPEHVGCAHGRLASTSAPHSRSAAAEAAYRSRTYRVGGTFALSRNGLLPLAGFIRICTR